MPRFEVLSDEVSKRIENAKLTGSFESFAFDDKDVVRRKNFEKDKINKVKP